MPLEILNSYAPRKSYPKEEQKEHWGKVEIVIEPIPRKHMAIWCANTNGQLGEVKENGEITPPK